MVIKRRPTTTRRNANGTAKIKRDGYSNDQTDWWTIRNAVFKRDDGKCQSPLIGGKCGKPGKEVHHVIALSKGGTTTGTNLITLCGDCHDSRHTGHVIRRGEDRPKPKNPWGRKPRLPPYVP